MTMTPHTLQTESITDELALMLVGAPKSGKSYLAGTAPGTILFLDFDQRLAALKSHPNVKNIYGVSFADPTDSNTMPTAFSEMLSVLARLEKSPMLSNLHESFAGKDTPVDTLVFDSVQTIANSAKNYVLYNGGNEGISRNFSIGGRVYRVPKSYTAWGAEMEMVSSSILQGRALLHCRQCWKSVTYQPSGPNAVGVLRHTADKQNKAEADTLDKDHRADPRAMNVIVTLHETPEEDPRSSEENPIYTGKITVYPVRYRVLLIYFNEVWRLVRDTGLRPQVFCNPDGRFTSAASALGLDKITAPDIMAALRDAKSMRPVVKK